MSRNRVDSPAQVEAIAHANHAEDRWTRQGRARGGRGKCRG